MLRPLYFIACLSFACITVGQGRPGHNLLHDRLPLGAVGQARQDLRGPLHCTYQPVQVSAYGKAQVSLAQNGAFGKGNAKSLYAGLTLGSVYRLRVTDIPLYPGQEVYPTIELVDRTYPPAGQEVRFAIPIVITEDDLQDAMQGKLVTRVIYLEDPQTALPLADQPGTQRDFLISGADDALEVADTLGRPVAIVRFGSRTPPTDYAQMNSFLLGCPAWLPLATPRSAAMIPEGQTAVIRTPHIPRTDLDTQPIPAQQRIATPAYPPYLVPQPQVIR